MPDHAKESKIISLLSQTTFIKCLISSGGFALSNISSISNNFSRESQAESVVPTSSKSSNNG